MLNSWKGVLIVWFSLFLLVTVFIYPLRGSMNSAIGSSMITEKLKPGMDIEVFADLGNTLKTLLSFMRRGAAILLLAGFILNSFLTAGLFSSVKKESGKFSAGNFFRSGAENFWSFLLISFIITILMFLICVFLIILPIGLVISSDVLSERTGLVIILTTILIFFLVIPRFFLVADFARAFRAENEKESGLRALSHGFSLGFRKSWPSYFMMLFLIIVQIGFMALVYLILPGWRPSSGSGAFTLLIVSQLAIYLRLMLKTWRYASVTSLFEESSDYRPAINMDRLLAGGPESASGPVEIQFDDTTEAMKDGPV